MKKNKYPIKLFDRISAKYDRTNRFLSLGLDFHWRRTLAKHVPASPSLQMLDLATGTGAQILALIQKKVPLQSAIGIDLSRPMLKIAKQKLLRQARLCPILFQHADAQELPFADQTFDLCTFSFGIRNVAFPHLALSEMHRVTKNHGRCLILEFSLPRNLLRPIFLFYLRNILPKLGRWLSREQIPYQYLSQSIEDFACKETFVTWMKQAGWNEVNTFNLFLGLVTLYQGDK